MFTTDPLGGPAVFKPASRTAFVCLIAFLAFGANAVAQSVKETEDGWVYTWDPDTELISGDRLPVDIGDPEEIRDPVDNNAAGRSGAEQLSGSTPEPNTLLLLIVGASPILYHLVRRHR